MLSQQTKFLEHNKKNKKKSEITPDKKQTHENLHTEGEEYLLTTGPTPNIFALLLLNNINSLFFCC